MMKTVKHTFTSIGDRSGDLARAFGSGTVDLARRVGDGTTTLARRVGPRRALIGFAVAAVAIGGSIVLIRYLRSRNAEGFIGEETDEQLGRGNGSRRARKNRQSDIQMPG